MFEVNNLLSKNLIKKLKTKFYKTLKEIHGSKMDLIKNYIDYKKCDSFYQVNPTGTFRPNIYDSDLCYNTTTISHILCDQFKDKESMLIYTSSQKIKLTLFMINETFDTEN